MSLFSIQNIAFSAWGYDVCWLELLGFFTGSTSIYLAGKSHVSTFFIGLFNCVLYATIFLQQSLYSMTLMQLFFFAINIYGIIKWGIPNKKGKEKKEFLISKLTLYQTIIVLLIIVVGGFFWGVFEKWIVTLFPHLQAPKYVYLDAILFISSVVGQLLLARKKLDNWILWIIVDIVSCILMVVLGLYLSALLYVVYTLISIEALYNWLRKLKQIKN